MRNFGDRAIGLFSRKKKNTGQVVENVANDIDDTTNKASKAALDIKHDANTLASNTGLFFVYKFATLFLFRSILSVQFILLQ